MGSSGNDPKRRKKLAIGGTIGGVLLVAAVYFGFMAFSDPAERTPTAELLTAEQRAADYYDQGLEALASGESSAATELFKKALALDSAHQGARDELTKITKQGASASTDDTGTPPPDTGPGGSDDVFLAPVADLTLLLPESVPDFEMGMVVAEETDAQITADPATPDLHATVRRALISVHDKQDASKATGFLASVTKEGFPENAATVTVDGREAYFGTDGAQFATIAYTRGRYVFEVIVTANDVPPGTLFDIATEVARAFPDTL